MKGEACLKLDSNQMSSYLKKKKKNPKKPCSCYFFA